MQVTIWRLDHVRPVTFLVGAILVLDLYIRIVLGEEKECSDLLKREKDVLQFVQDKLIDAGAEKVKVAHVGSNEFSVNGSSVSFDKKDIKLLLEPYGKVKIKIIKRIWPDYKYHHPIMIAYCQKTRMPFKSNEQILKESFKTNLRYSTL